jgi:homocysteine S-methyltransferase
MDFLEALHARPIIGDGAMGTLLFDRGIPRDACLEDLCATDPERIQAIHREYLAAGAQFIRTHSFGSNSVRLARFDFERRVGELNWLAARTAREAMKGSDAWVAASVGPTGLQSGDYREFVSIFEEQLGGLLDGGAHFVILETFTNLEELKAALEAKQSLHHCPVIASITGIRPEQAGAVFAELRETGADAVGINCVDPAAASVLVDQADLSEPVSVFPSAGLPVERDGQLHYPIGSDEFAKAAFALVERGVRVIGGCCGTTPDHIAALARLMKPPEQP